MVNQRGDKQMRKMLAFGGVLFLAACGGNPSVPPQVSWQYGTGNGDPVAYNGAPTKYSFGNGLGTDMPVPAGQMPTVSRGYGADGTTGVMEQTTPAAQQQQYAAPSQSQHPAIAPPTSSHL